MTSPYNYALPGPPFNFLGHMSQTQNDSLNTWITRNSPNQPLAMAWYQIRANQLRKSAGLLEKYYATEYPDISAPQPMLPSFQKAEWQPGPSGHFTYVNGNDQLSAVNMSKIKNYYQYMLQRDDEGMFWMNWLRNHIERHEDMANLHNDAEIQVPLLQTELTTMFGKNEYQNVLVDDIKTPVVGVNNISIPGPYFRVNQLDQPTAWELSQFSHLSSGAAIPGTPQQAGAGS